MTNSETMPSFSKSYTPKRQKIDNLNNGNKISNNYMDRKRAILQHRISLPIASVEKRLVDEVRKNDTIIIVGETGSGKTTQLPQYLSNAGFCCDGKVIGITQPRRVAAVTVAKRVAEECDVQLGQKVGYAIRFEDVTSRSTRIKYMTDGLLLREALLDPILSRYNIIIVDEAHERTVHTDVLLGLLKKVQDTRLQKQKLDKPDLNNLVQFDNGSQRSNTKLTPLKLIIMSASLDAKGFSEYFGGAKAFHVQGRQHPVDILYTYHPEPDYVDATLIMIFQEWAMTNSETMPSFSKSYTPKRQKIDNLNNGNKISNNYMDRKRAILQHRISLPIASVEKRLVDEVRKNDTIIIVGETGSGKTTQLPQYLSNAGFCCDGKVIGITQPRRVAAVTVAKRVAEECDVQLGQKVGYAIRFEDVTSRSTRIKYMTDGLLLREALLDPILSRYNIIIVDEAHERTVHTDVLLGLLKKVQDTRLQKQKLDKPDLNNLVQFDNGSQRSNTKLTPLKLIIMSASLDAKGFSEYFGGAKAFHVQGRQHPVDILYTYHPEPDYVDATLIMIFQIHLEEGPGDILAFLTGQEEIESVDRLVHERLKQLPEGSRNILTVPIYSSLPSEHQMNVFKPTPVSFRKVILATNIAETSVTIPGVKYVIDTGLVKVKNYNPVTGMESLIIIPISKAQSLQRSGRAGREGPGKCFRLYPESEFWKLKDSAVPEIKRCNLSNIVLQLKALGIDNLLEFDFMEKPSREAITNSLQQLYLLGALTDDCKLTDPVGFQMARFPLDPIYSKALILSAEFKCSEEMLIVVAMLSVESIFYSPREKLEEARSAWKRFSSSDGDHQTLVIVFRAAAEYLEKIQAATSKTKTIDKNLNRWCCDNFINNRSLKHALDVHSQIKRHLEQIDMSLSSCGDDMLQFRKCLTASFFLNAAEKQPDGSYRIWVRGGRLAVVGMLVDCTC